MSQTILKPWGREIIITEPGLPYTGKILVLRAGRRISLQQHDQKTETLTLISGQVKITQGPTVESLSVSSMAVNEGITIHPGTIHRLEAITDSVIFETASPETGTTYRLDDDYQRPDETDIIRNSPNRGWSQT